MRSDRNRANTACLETHFWCPGKEFCVPVFVRCNGVFDCPGHEDEEGCSEYACPGFYRCRSSKVCLHVTHVCDDWPLCPQRDDELLCAQSCPLHCTCLGLAFHCSAVFAAAEYPDLRYLDVRGSGMDVRELGKNHMLIHLSLARCSVNTLSSFNFQNLHSLDLSDNQLTKLYGHYFDGMPHLTVLFLAGNPLTSAVVINSSHYSEMGNLRILDLSRLNIHVLEPDLFTFFPSLRFLNLSQAKVEMLQWNSSQIPVMSIYTLDLRGCTIKGFSPDVLRGFLGLQLLFTDNFKLCCPSVLPPGFELSHCHVTSDDVTSCDVLLGSPSYHAAVAVLATLALLGNTFSLVIRVCIGKTWRLSSCRVVLTHLSVADLGTGIYLAMLGIADRLMAGHYVWKDDAWRSGAACLLAGVLAMSCRHAALFLVAVLTLDRCLHRFPALPSHLTPAKVNIVCVVAWTTSLLLSTVPLMSHWRLFGQQALCLPLPHKVHDSLESRYAYGVMVFAHFFLLVLCFICEIVVSISDRVAKPGFKNTTARLSQSSFVVLGSLASGFLYTIACLVPTDSHTDRQKAAHTALVYFGSVVSSAMNPYLHLYGVKVERSKRIKEERLLRIINRAHD